MNYAEIINNTTLRDGVIKASSSPFKAELLPIIEETIIWLSQEPDFLDDDFINWTTQWLEQIGTEQFEVLLRNYQTAISKLVNATNKKEGNFINSKTSELLDEEYVTAASAAICSLKLCLDMLKGNSTEYKVLTSIKVIFSQVLWLDTILHTLMYAEWRNDKEAIGQNTQSPLNLYVEQLAKGIWVEKKMTYVSSILISELAIAKIKQMNHDFKDDGSELFTEGLCDLMQEFEVDPYSKEQDENIDLSYSEQWNKRYGEKNWQLNLNEQGGFYSLLTNVSVTEALKDESKLINNFKRHLSRAKLIDRTSPNRQKAIKTLEEICNFKYNPSKRIFLPIN